MSHAGAEIESTLRKLVREEVVRAFAELGGGAPERLITVAAAAELASVQPATIRAWISDGRIPASRAGRRLRVRAADVQAAMAAPRSRRQDPIDELADRAVRAALAKSAGGARPRPIAARGRP